EDASRLNVGFGTQGGQHITGGIRVIEGESGGTIFAHDGGNNAQVTGHTAAEIQQVISANRQTAQQQSGAAGGHDEKGELAADGDVAEAAHQLAPPPTLTTRATASSLELSLRWWLSAAPRLISKRTRSCSRTKLMEPPRRRKSALSPTVSTGRPRVRSRPCFKISGSDWLMKRTWQRRTSAGDCSCTLTMGRPEMDLLWTMLLKARPNG